MCLLRLKRALRLAVAFVAGAAVTATATGIALSDPGGAMPGHRTTEWLTGKVGVVPRYPFQMTHAVFEDFSLRSGTTTRHQFAGSARA